MRPRNLLDPRGRPGKIGFDKIETAERIAPLAVCKPSRLRRRAVLPLRLDARAAAPQPHAAGFQGSSSFAISSAITANNAGRLCRTVRQTNSSATLS